MVGKELVVTAVRQPDKNRSDILARNGTTNGNVATYVAPKAVAKVGPGVGAGVVGGSSDWRQPRENAD